MAQNFPATGSPPMIGKMLSIAEWLDYVASYNFGSLAPSRLVLHHTWRPDEGQWRGLASMKGMQSYYAGKGWSSAPHIYTGADGIWLFTPMSQIGIHAGTGNGSIRQGWYSIGLEMVGNYDKKRPSGAIWQNSLAVMGGLSRRLNIAPRQLISFHRDYTNQKSCPGWAVTKDWVWGEVEAWLKGAAPPAPPPQGQVGLPTPSDELLLETLLQESYARKGQGYNSDWAFHQYAVEHGLGMPMSASQTITVDGKQINFQVFARDTLFCEVPNWGDVQTLSDLLKGTIPPGGVGKALLEATYRAGGATFRSDWAFHQYALMAKLGPPVGQSGTITVGGKQYAYQVFAADTLYNLVPNWSDVKQLSQLSSATDSASVQLREALLAETYKKAGTTYRSDWAFHQLARTHNVGAPLASSQQITLEGTTYALQVYATDTFYNVVPNWSDVRRLKDLAHAGGMPSFTIPPSLSDVPPVEGEFTVLAYSPAASAFSERGGKVVEKVVLHGVGGEAVETLAKMSLIGSRFATHYLVGLDGTIYRLVDEKFAAWHCGFAFLDGLWYNLNRVSIGIALERPADWPEQYAESSEQQLMALRWLLRDIAKRHRITPEAVMLWSSLAGSDDPSENGLPITVIREALAR